MNLRKARLLLLVITISYAFGAFYVASGMGNGPYYFFWDTLTKINISMHEKKYPDMLKNFPIAIISIDEESLSELNMRWPWNRRLFADAIKKLEPHKPKVLVMDLLLSHPDNRAENDQELYNAMRHMDHAILGSLIDNKGFYEKPHELFTKAIDQDGFINLPQSRDSKIREVILVSIDESGEMIAPSLSLVAVMSYLDSPNKPKLLYPEVKSVLPKLSVRLGRDGSETTISSTDSRFRAGINYLVHPMNIPRISFWKLLTEDPSMKDLEGKLVFLGIDSMRYKDYHPSPFGLVSGVSIHAAAAYSMLHNALIRVAPLQLSNLLFLLCTALIAFLFVYHHKFIGILTTFAVIAGLLLLGVYLFFVEKIILDITFPIIGLFLLFLGHLVHDSTATLVENLRLKNQLSYDALTQVYSFRYFELLAESIFSKMKNDQVISFVVMDLDQFKEINDTFGHNKGNDVLKLFTAILKKHVRKGDYVARFGGDEFCALLDTNEEGVKKFLVRVEEELGRRDPDKDGIPFFSFSAGVAIAKKSHFDKLKDLLEEADKALYEAKRAGRDQFRVKTI